MTIYQLSDIRIDTSLYHPEKRISIEFIPIEESGELTALTQELHVAESRLASLLENRHTQMQTIFHDKLEEKGLTIKSFGHAAFDHFTSMGITNFSKFMQNYVWPFSKNFKTDEAHLSVFCKILDLQTSDFSSDTSEITDAKKSINTLKNRILSLTESPFDLFKREFQLLWKYRENICNTPELYNIQVDHVGYSYAYINFGPLTLGMLLNLYHQGLLRVGHCKKCGHETLGYYFCGSILSGSGSHNGFCPLCGTEDQHQGHGYVHRHFADYKHPFSFEPTEWNIQTLVAALKRIEKQ